MISILYLIRRTYWGYCCESAIAIVHLKFPQQSHIWRIVCYAVRMVQFLKTLIIWTVQCPNRANLTGVLRTYYSVCPLDITQSIYNLILLCFLFVRVSPWVSEDVICLLNVRMVRFGLISVVMKQWCLLGLVTYSTYSFIPRFLWKNTFNV